MFLHFQRIQSKHEKQCARKQAKPHARRNFRINGIWNYSEINEAFAMLQISQRSSLLFLINFSILTGYFRPKS